MKTFLIILGLIILVIAIFGLYRLVTVKRQNRKLNAERFERVKELYEKLESGQNLTEKDVLPFAQNVLTRESTYQLLRDQNKTDIFPKEYNTIVKGAESNLANWLEFPTELNACPDEIEHLKRVTYDFDGQNNFVHYEVFKCRVNEPHWAAKDGWFLGVVGPYFDDSKPYDFPHATFSRINSTLNNITADEEAKWVHENISLRR
ncbi:hypothetical protein [uncultured Flavobacterium sp.]|uniref:hypothetical protein n=1 Tax=uncultured Flavobacterium sp. TaxID=165435 RepID=UPI000FB31CB4|nr:hypothetical protein [uncultured Flavobacterium sp.]